MDTLRLSPLEHAQSDPSPGVGAWRSAGTSAAARTTVSTMKLEAAATVRGAPGPRASIRELMILRGIATSGQVGAISTANSGESQPDANAPASRARQS